MTFMGSRSHNMKETIVVFYPLREVITWNKHKTAPETPEAVACSLLFVADLGLDPFFRDLSLISEELYCRLPFALERPADRIRTQLLSGLFILKNNPLFAHCFAFLYFNTTCIKEYLLNFAGSYSREYLSCICMLYNQCIFYHGQMILLLPIRSDQ